jgi:hypothetical protein
MTLDLTGFWDLGFLEFKLRSNCEIGPMDVAVASRILGVVRVETRFL